MPQVSLYVDDQAMEELRADAAREGTSLSKYVAARIRRDSQLGVVSGAPTQLLDKLYGCLADDDSFARPPQLEYDFDAPRLAFE